MPAVSIPATLPDGLPGTSLIQAIAALFTAGALTDLTPFLGPARPTVSGGTLASRPVVAKVPRMRTAEAPGPPGPPAIEADSGARGEPRPFGKLTGQHPGLLPVGPQRHAGRPVGGQPYP